MQVRIKLYIGIKERDLIAFVRVRSRFFYIIGKSSSYAILIYGDISKMQKKSMDSVLISENNPCFCQRNIPVKEDLKYIPVNL